MSRLSKDEYYLNLALDVARRSTCIRRCYGAIIVNNDEIISTGYNGAPRGEVNCVDSCACLREEFHIKSGEHYELCRSVHAEANAIISASRQDMLGGTLYLSGFEYNNPDVEQNISYPCKMCQRLIRNSGIKYIVYRKNGEIKIDSVDSFEHDNIVSKEKITDIVKTAVLLNKKSIKNNEIFTADVLNIINKINLMVEETNIYLSIKKDKDFNLIIENNITNVINQIYMDHIIHNKYKELSEFISIINNNNFYDDKYYYGYKGRIDELPIMKTILKYLTDKDDISEYINVSSVDDRVYFNLTTNLHIDKLNISWYLFFKLKNSLILID